MTSNATIEPMINHARNDGRLGGNYLLSYDGGRIKTLLAASSHNLRLIFGKLRLLFAQTLAALLGPMARLDAWPTPGRLASSMA